MVVVDGVQVVPDGQMDVVGIVVNDGSPWSISTLTAVGSATYNWHVMPPHMDVVGVEDVVSVVDDIEVDDGVQVKPVGQIVVV